MKKNAFLFITISQIFISQLCYSIWNPFWSINSLNSEYRVLNAEWGKDGFSFHPFVYFKDDWNAVLPPIWMHDSKDNWYTLAPLVLYHDDNMLITPLFYFEENERLLFPGFDFSEEGNQILFLGFNRDDFIVGPPIWPPLVAGNGIIPLLYYYSRGDIGNFNFFWFVYNRHWDNDNNEKRTDFVWPLFCVEQKEEYPWLSPWVYTLKEHSEFSSVLEYIKKYETSQTKLLWKVFNYTDKPYKKELSLFFIPIKWSTGTLEERNLYRKVVDISEAYDEWNRYMRIDSSEEYALERGGDALALAEKYLGTNHLDVARSLFHIANCYEKKQEYTQAEQYAVRAMDIRSRLMGSQHTDTIYTRNYIEKMRLMSITPGIHIQDVPASGLNEKLSNISNLNGSVFLMHGENPNDNLLSLYSTYKDDGLVLQSISDLPGTLLVDRTGIIRYVNLEDSYLARAAAILCDAADKGVEVCTNVVIDSKESDVLNALDGCVCIVKGEVESISETNNTFMIFFKPANSKGMVARTINTFTNIGVKTGDSTYITGIINKDNRRPLINIYSQMQITVINNRDSEEIVVDPDLIQILYSRALLERYEKDYYILVKGGPENEALNRLGQRILELGKSNAQMMNGFAWRILTEGKFLTRDVDLVLKASTAAVIQTNYENHHYIDTYALALYKSGKISEAIKQQLKAISMCDDENLKKEYVGRLEMYRKNQ